MYSAFTEYSERVSQAFGDSSDPIEAVALRAELAFAGLPVIVWEGDAQTFAFSFVSPSAETVLGHPRERWTGEATFWVDHVVHPDDRDEAVGYCALATGKGQDHAFEYRATTADGRVVTLLDFVRVVVGPRRIAERLRGIMVAVGAPAASPREAPAWQSPTRATLQSM